MNNEKNEKNQELKIRKVTLRAPEVLESRIAPDLYLVPSKTTTSASYPNYNYYNFNYLYF